MTTDDGVNASIAASLVRGNMTFNTVVVDRVAEDSLRLFRLSFIVHGREFEITGYAAGAVLTAMSAMRLDMSGEAFTAKRHELADFVSERMPVVRVRRHPYAEPPGDENVIWVEASVPIPEKDRVTEGMDQMLARSPFVLVAGAVDALAEHFSGILVPTKPSSLPFFTAERSAARAEAG